MFQCGDGSQFFVAVLTVYLPVNLLKFVRTVGHHWSSSSTIITIIIISDDNVNSVRFIRSKTITLPLYTWRGQDLLNIISSLLAQIPGHLSFLL